MKKKVDYSLFRFRSRFLGLKPGEFRKLLTDKGGETLSETIAFRMTPTEAAAANERAAELGLTRAQYFRGLHRLAVICLQPLMKPGEHFTE